MTQSQNLALKKLGFPADARVAIIHTDDIGMCQSTISAYDSAMEFGLMSASSTMVPCSWFPSAAQHSKALKNADMGVHLTTTCEWDTYRWGPISTGDPASGMIDAEGYFYRSVDEFVKNATVEAVEKEIDAQVQRALDAGIDLTHIDVHMGTVMSPKFVPSYLKLAQKYNLPPLVFRETEEGLRKEGLDEEAIRAVLKNNQMMEESGIPLMDAMKMMPLYTVWDNRAEQAMELFEGLQTGLTYFIFHPAADTPEIRAIAPDWKARIGDYSALMSPELRQFIKDQGIEIIGYRVLRDLMRNSAG